MASIAVIGTGYVGLVSGACLADAITRAISTIASKRKRLGMSISLWSVEF